MAIEKIGGITGASYIRPIERRLETVPDRRDVLVLRGTVTYADLAQRRFALIQDGHTCNVVWSAATTFSGIDARSMQGAEVSVKVITMADGFHAESVVAAH